MLEPAQLQNLPKALLLDLHRTAGVLAYDLHTELETVRGELEAEWAHVVPFGAS